ncbi:MAG TPA: aspartyl protease family protein [Bryobacteraceae bacterium]|nr:aspartyl protease family protein [Bryobacteraceae bacterium]
MDDAVATGRKALANDGVATAWRLAQKALMNAPESAVVHEFAGEVHFRRGEIGEADAEFKAAIDWNPQFALAWWGLGRVAECSAMNKAAVEDFHRAFELDPNDTRVLAAWIAHLSGQERANAIKKYEALLNAQIARGSADAKQAEGLRQAEDLMKALNGHPAMALASPYQKSEVPLVAFMNPATRIRTYGLDVLVDGKPARLVLDTGAAGITLSRFAAQRLGLTRVTDATVGGIGDDAKLGNGYRAIAQRLQIGSVEYRNAVIAVAGENVGLEDGLIGTNVMDEFQMTLDFAAGKLRLEPIANFRPETRQLPDRTLSADMANATRVYRFGHLLLVPVQVGKARDKLFVLDTGAGSTLISYSLAAEIGNLDIDDKTSLRGLSGRVGNVFKTGNVALQFAGFEQRNLAMNAFDTWELSHRIGTEISGFLGLPVLDLFTLTIDYVNGLVKFERAR